jgi:hypothetical protein
MCALLNGTFVASPIEARSSRSVITWNNSSAPLGSTWTYPTSSSYADIRIDRSMPTPQLCRAWWLDGVVDGGSRGRLIGIVTGFPGTPASCREGGNGRAPWRLGW